MPVRTTRVWSLLLLPAGLYVGHRLGYWLTEEAGSVPSMMTGHGYLAGLAGLAIPFTVAVLARAFLAGRDGDLAPIRFETLALQQVALFVTVEVVEHAAAGIGPATSLREASLAIGALSQVAVAAAFWTLTRLLGHVGAALAPPRQSVPPRATRPLAPRCLLLADLAAELTSISRRGPPAILPI